MPPFNFGPGSFRAKTLDEMMRESLFTPEPGGDLIVDVDVVELTNFVARVILLRREYIADEDFGEAVTQELVDPFLAKHDPRR